MNLLGKFKVSQQESSRERKQNQVTLFSLGHYKTETSHRHVSLLPLQSVYKNVCIIDLCMYLFLKLLNNGLWHERKEKSNSCSRAVKWRDTARAAKAGGALATVEQKKYNGTHILDSSSVGYCFLRRASPKQAKWQQEPSSPISSGSGSGWCCSTCCAPPGFLTDCRAICRLINSSCGVNRMSRLYVLPQQFTAWCNLKTLSLNSCKIAAAYFCLIQTQLKSAEKMPTSDVFSRLFKGSKFQSLRVSFIYITSFTDHFAHCNSFINL